ncbi:MAG: hypothetical protein LBD78_06830 [Spirochaetaceae bacterium]|jgi:hypothetical protein|nr:hypothetical protein [Spirochaetaceae bacterium]
MGGFGGMALGDIAEIPGPFIKNPRGIRDIEGWLTAHVLYPDYVRTIFEYQTGVMLKNLGMYRQAVGDHIQVIWLSGTDFGTQCSLMQSKEIFLSLYKPYYKKVNDWVHQNTPWKVFYHSCGAREQLEIFTPGGAVLCLPRYTRSWRRRRRTELSASIPRLLRRTSA